MAAVLIVEGDREVAYVFGRMFARLGYVSQPAYDGKTALEKLKTQPFDILLTDLNLRNISVVDLIWCALQIRPHLKIIVCGTPPNQIRLTGLVDRELQKPFTLTQLRAALDGLLQ